MQPRVQLTFLCIDIHLNFTRGDRYIGVMNDTFRHKSGVNNSGVTECAGVSRLPATLRMEQGFIEDNRIAPVLCRTAFQDSGGAP